MRRKLITSGLVVLNIITLSFSYSLNTQLGEQRNLANQNKIEAEAARRDADVSRDAAVVAQAEADRQRALAEESMREAVRQLELAKEKCK